MDLSTAITRIVRAPSPSRFSPLACFVSLHQSASEIPKRDTQNSRSQTRYPNSEVLKDMPKFRDPKRCAQIPMSQIPRCQISERLKRDPQTPSSKARYVHNFRPLQRDVKIPSSQKRCPNSEVLNKIHEISRSQTRSINTEVPKSSVRLLMTLGSETRVRKNWKQFIYLWTYMSP